MSTSARRRCRRICFASTRPRNVIFRAEDLPAGFAYVALGHIHQPQRIGGLDHMRYSGSIERLDLGEANDAKSAVLFELDGAGLCGAPRLVPLDATPLYDLAIDEPETQMPGLRERYPEAARALVRFRLTWKAGTHDRDELLRELEAIFPRWYQRDVVEAGRWHGHRPPPVCRTRSPIRSRRCATSWSASWKGMPTAATCCTWPRR